MLTTPTLDKLRALNLTGMARAFAEQQERADYQALSFEDRLGLMVDREAQDRDNRRSTATSRSPSCASAPVSRTSTSVARGVSSAASCSALPKPSG